MDFLAWLEVHKWQIAVAAAVVAIAVGAVVIYSSYRQERELQANTALLKAQRAADQQATDQRPSAERLLQVASDFGGTEAANRALLLAGRALFDAGKFAEASRQFEAFLRDSGGSSLAPSAAFGIAACLDAQGKTNEAVAAYQGVQTTYPNSSPATQARLALAGLFEAGKDYAQAVKLYSELSTPGQPSAWGLEAGMRRENLLRLHPELAVTNAPALTPPVSAAASGGLLSATSSPSPTASPAP